MFVEIVIVIFIVWSNLIVHETKIVRNIFPVENSLKSTVMTKFVFALTYL